MTPITTAITSDTDNRPVRPLLVKIADAGRMLALSRSSIYQLIWDGELTPVRIGRSLRFSVDHLEAFVVARLAHG